MVDEGVDQPGQDPRVSRRDFLWGSVLAATGATLAGCQVETAPQTAFERKLKDLAQDVPQVTVTTVYRPLINQQLSLDVGHKRVQRFIREGAELVKEGQSREESVQALASHVSATAVYKEEMIGKEKSLSQVLEKGAGCLGQIVSLTVLIEHFLPEAQPRMVGLRLRTEVSRQQLAEEEDWRVAIDGGLGHFLVLFEGSDGEVMAINPVDSQLKVISYQDYAAEQKEGMKIVRLARWQPEENK